MTKAVPGKPVRLRVGYKSPQSLLTELTRSVGRGGVRIESKRMLAVGTRFVFELQAEGVKHTVEVEGTVQSVSEPSPGQFAVLIRYDPPKEQAGLEAVIQHIFKEPLRSRHAPRVPLSVRAVEDREGAPSYRLRDISRLGVGIDVEAAKLPAHVKVGMPFLLQMKLKVGTLKAAGEVAWAVEADTKSTLLPRIGATFRPMAPASAQLLDDLINLRALPHPPWIARVAFGAAALE
jgi:hypothetical protein